MAVAVKPKVRAKEYKPDYPIDWCPGCGDFGIVNAIHQALARLEIPRHKVAVFGGIGCSGKAQYYVNTYGIHTLHGRPVPFAIGTRLANPELYTLIVSGDGDSLGIGAGHFVAAGRRNVNLTYILFDNEVYGLTKGQAAPTLPLGLRTKAMAMENIQGAVNGLMLACATGYTWIGRGYAYNIKQLVDLLVQAIEHPGLAFLDVLQPCPTYNNLHTKEWFAGEDVGHPRLYDLQEEGYDPVIPEDADKALMEEKMLQFYRKANEWGDRIPTGVFLVNRNVSTFEERLAERFPAYKAVAPAKQPLADEDGITLADLTPIFQEHLV